MKNFALTILLFTSFAYAEMVIINEGDSGDVIGQASAIDSEVALFSGTDGKTIKRGTGTGFAKLTSGVLSAAADVDAATELTGITPVANGGTGSSTSLVTYGSATSPGTALCIWTNSGTVAFTAMTDTDCPVATVSGIATAPATKKPAITLPIGAGPVLDFAISGTFRADRAAATNAGCFFDLYDGTTSYPIGSAIIAGASGNQAIVTSAFNKRIVLGSVLGSAKTYEIRAYANSATTVCTIANDDSALTGFQIAVTSHP